MKAPSPLRAVVGSEMKGLLCAFKRGPMKSVLAVRIRMWGLGVLFVTHEARVMPQGFACSRALNNVYATSAGAEGGLIATWPLERRRSANTSRQYPLRV